MFKLLLTGAFGLGILTSSASIAQAKHHTADKMEETTTYTKNQLREDLNKGCFEGNPIPYNRCVRNKAQKCTAAVKLMREYKRKEANIKREFRKCLQDRS